MSVYRAPSVLLDETSQSVGASKTGQVVSREFNLPPDAATRAMRLDIECSGVTKTTGITVKLQHAVADGEDFADVDSTDAAVTIDDDGWFAIVLSSTNSSTADLFPLRQLARVVVSTGADDAVTVDDIRFGRVD